MIHAHLEYDDQKEYLRFYFKRTSKTYCKSYLIWKKGQRKLNDYQYYTAYYHKGYQ